MAGRPVQLEAEASNPVPLPDVLKQCFAPGLLHVAGDRTIRAGNPEAGRILQSPDIGFTGQSLAALPAPLRELIEEALSGTEPLSSRSITLFAHSKRESSLVVSILREVRENQLPDLIVVLHDVTAARRLDERIKQLDRLATTGALAASAAHEIKNALVPLKTFVDLAGEKGGDHELLDLARRELQRVNSLVSQMLHYSGPVAAQYQQLDLHAAIGQALRAVHHELMVRNIELNISLDAKPSLVRGDSRQLEQVFINLFLNAAAATSPGGKLTVQTETIPSQAPHQAGEPGWIRATIADTGCGIPKEIQARLFEPFFTTKSEGTGLGLWISRRVVHEHGGNFTFESQPGRGTTFILNVPASTQRESIPSRPA